MVKKIAIIGSNCFSAAHFVDYCLTQGYQVYGVSRSQQPSAVYLPYELNKRDGFEFLQGDLNHDLKRIVEGLRAFKPTIIANFAAQGMVAESWQNPVQWFQTNAIGHIGFHEAVRNFDSLDKYVHISTPEVYGSTEGRVREDFPYNPSTPYAASKAACDMSLKTFFRNYNFPVCTTRAANVYGPCQALYRIIPKTIFCVMMKKKLPLHGGGHSVRSFIHMRDVCEGTLRVAEMAKPGEIFHFSTDRFVSIRDLVAMICTDLGAKFEDAVEITGERPGKDAYYILDSSKARATLNWADKITLEQGIAETIKWVRDHLEELKTHPDYYIHKA